MLRRTALSIISGIGLRLPRLGIILFSLTAATEWDAKYLTDEGTGYCVFGTQKADKSSISFVSMKADEKEVGVAITDPRWSFVEDKMYPDVTLGTEVGRFAPATARGIEAGLMIATTRSSLAAFVREGVKEDGTLAVYQGDKLLATFSLEGMRDKYNQFVACDTIKFRDPAVLPKDPFKP